MFYFNAFDYLSFLVSEFAQWYLCLDGSHFDYCEVGVQYEDEFGIAVACCIF